MSEAFHDSYAAASPKGLYMTLKQTSEYTQIPRSTLRLYMQTKNLPCYKISKRLLFNKSEIDNWLSGFRYKPEIDTLVAQVLNSIHLQQDTSNAC